MVIRHRAGKTSVIQRFSLTALGEALKTGAPGSARGTVLTIGSSWYGSGLENIVHSVQTGSAGFEKAQGMPFFDYLAQQPEESSMFSEAMVGFSSQNPPAVAAAYDFSPFKTIVDVGGATGTRTGAVHATPSVELETTMSFALHEGRKRQSAHDAYSVLPPSIASDGSEMARIGELTDIQRVWIVTQAAKLLAKTDRDKALSLVDDAATEARRIEELDLDRPRGLLAVANALKLVEPSRAWDAVFDAVKAANSTEGFTGEDGLLALALTSKSLLSFRKESVPDFDIDGIFGKLANDDYHRTVQLASAWKPRANCTVRS